MKKKFPQVIFPPSSDICYATTNRQTAVKKLAEVSDLILVVGSATSSNTNRLVDVAKNLGIKSFRINGPEDIKKTWFNNIKNIGITSGASVPENLVQQVIKFLQNNYNVEVEESEIIKEKVWFDLPAEIKKVALEQGSGRSIVKKHDISTNSKMVVK